MESRYTSKFDGVDILFFIIGLLCVIMPLYYWIDESRFSMATVVFLVLGATALIAAYIRSSLAVHDINTLEKRICNELDKQGFRHEKKDGTLYVVKKESIFRILMWDTSKKRFKRLYFVYDFEDERHKNISKEGWMMATNRINADNPHTTFITFDELFRCRYETVISNAHDFLSEFETAYQFIGDAVEDINRIYPYLERDYPNNVRETKSGIGFKANG